MLKRILTIQDISCVGKCSLTVALPVISSLGVEAAVIPTAVLSAHTAFKHFTFRDLTADIPDILEAWKVEKLSFDAVYSGYLGSERQISLVKSIFRDFAPRFRIVDPAMADGGRLYRGIASEFADGMRLLCAEADVIVPNLTEACLLTRQDYWEHPNRGFCRDLLKRLTLLGENQERGLKPVLTGAGFSENEVGAMMYDPARDEFFEYFGERLPASFHGTGDIFASVLSGALTRGSTLEDAIRLAVDFTRECVIQTVKDPDRRWYGVSFENALPYLSDWVRNHK